MPGPSRINTIGMLCSCVGHALLFGGFILYSEQKPSKRLAPAQSTAPMVVDIVPAEQAAEPPRTRVAVDRRKDPVPAVGASNGRMAAVATATGPVRVSDNISSKEPDTESAAASGSMSTAPSPAELSDYQRRLYEIVAQNSRYPAEAKQRRLAGVTQLAFRLDRLGNVLESWVHKSSGSEVLDNAALEALERAQPLPPIPPALPSRMDFVIEIDSSVMQQVALVARH
jgi:periplasmic protein TonB